MGRLSALDVWLGRGKVVVVGGRALKLMPLPLKRLMGVGEWLQGTAQDVVDEALDAMAAKDRAPNPVELVSKVLMKIDTAEVALVIFTAVKNPETGQCVNEGLTKEFFDEHLDVVTAQEVFMTFIEVNKLEELLKNLQRLPIVQKLTEVATISFGLPFLNSLQQSTASNQTPSEGSQSPKSSDISKRDTSAESAATETPSRNLTTNQVSDRIM